MSKTLKLIGIAVIALVIIGYIIYAGSNKPKYDTASGPQPFEGREDAKVVIDEYSDFQCPACKAVVPFVKALNEKYGANVRINYQYYPLESIHKDSLSASLAAACANDQGKFWEMHDLLFGYQEAGLGKDNLRKAAGDAKLDMTLFNACLDSQARLPQIREDQKAGNALQLTGTPTFAINGVLIKDRSTIDATIREALGLPPEVAAPTPAPKK